MSQPRLAILSAVAAVLLIATGCAVKTVSLAPDDLAAATAAAGLDKETATSLVTKPLYEMSEQEVGTYLAFAQARYPDLRERISHLAHKNLDQPYEIFLLGEAPFENYDAQPLYCIDRSDCVVFSEHTYAYALSNDWPSFFTMLQRIRYKDGRIGVATRNHYTEADWIKNNTWLIEDISRELAGEDTATFKETINRSKFLRNRYKLESSFPIEKIEEDYIPLEKVPGIASGLQSGDFVNFVRGRNGGLWVGHVGLVVVDDDGTVNVIHSTPPRVRKERLVDIVERSIASIPERKANDKSVPFGFKFLRLEDDPLANLRAIDGAGAPLIYIPGGLPVAVPAKGE